MKFGFISSYVLVGILGMSNHVSGSPVAEGTTDPPITPDVPEVAERRLPPLTPGNQTRPSGVTSGLMNSAERLQEASSAAVRLLGTLGDTTDVGVNSLQNIVTMATNAVQSLSEISLALQDLAAILNRLVIVIAVFASIFFLIAIVSVLLNWRRERSKKQSKTSTFHPQNGSNPRPKNKQSA